MTNFEKLLNAMTIETFMDMSIRLVVVNQSKLCWLTSSNQLFDYDNYNAAFNHELHWLMTDDDVKADTDDINNSPETESEKEACKICGGGENCKECLCEICPMKEEDTKNG